MRFLDTTNGRFRWIEDPSRVNYAILSHVWDKDGEQTYLDVRQIQVLSPENESVLPQLSPKIQQFCEAARRDGFELGWVDSCCIDKTSSSELSEAINSMYDWYRFARVCYAYLHDVEPSMDDEELTEAIGSSRWFKRGWTLQELLAPAVVLFLSHDWKVIGSKYMLSSLIERVTGIDQNVLTMTKPVTSVSVARRMSWAASRETTRVEDEAYSLMGIFDVTMPTTYGEGRYAFIRLQQEIMRRTADQTIFAWGSVLADSASKNHAFSFCHPSSTSLDYTSIPLQPETEDRYLLASSPKEFEQASDLRSISRRSFANKLHLQSDDTSYQMYKTTPYGIRADFPLVAVVSSSGDHRVALPTHLAVLACEDAAGRWLALLLRPREKQPSREYWVGATMHDPRDATGSEPFYYRAMFICPDVLRDIANVSRIFIPHQPTYAMAHDAPRHAILRDTQDAYTVSLSRWSKKLLHMQGYTISQEDDRSSRGLFSSDAMCFVVSGWDVRVRVQIGRCGCRFGQAYRGALAVQVTSGSTTDALVRKQVKLHQHNDPTHISSWKFDCGAASKECTLPGAGQGSGTDEPFVKLTFTHDPSTSAPGVTAYQLGVEMLAHRTGFYRGPRPLPSRRGSRLPVPIRPASQQSMRAQSHLAPCGGPLPLQRTRSNSHPPSLFARARSPTPSEYSGLLDDDECCRRTASPEPLSHSTHWQRPGRSLRGRSPRPRMLAVSPPPMALGYSSEGEVSEEMSESAYDPATPPRGSPQRDAVRIPDEDVGVEDAEEPPATPTGMGELGKLGGGGVLSGLLSYLWGWRIAFY